MRWLLPWTLAVVTAAAAGSALATVSPAWRGRERGPCSLLHPLLLLGGQDEGGWKGGRTGRGDEGEAQGEEWGCLGSAG